MLLATSEVRNYELSELQLGQIAEFSVTITEMMQEQFCQMSGDINPLHTDASFAKGCGYEGRVVYGMLTASFFSTLAGVYLPGRNCLFLKCDVEWPKPTYIGDDLTITGKIVDISKTLHTVEIKAVVHNQRKEKVARATLLVRVNSNE